jgi:phosphoglycolate phosphatase-like HAD superfamily hydrolase
MVGDTEADIAAAKKHDIKIIAVESGIRDRTQLASYQPDMILPDLKTVVDYLIN